MLFKHTVVTMLFPLLIRTIVTTSMNGQTNYFFPAGSDCLLNHLASTSNTQKTTKKHGGNIAAYFGGV